MEGGTALCLMWDRFLCLCCGGIIVFVYIIVLYDVNTQYQ